MPAPPPYPIIVGVTGHRDIAPEHHEAERTALQTVLTSLYDQFGDALLLMTALADGADQLAADVAEKLIASNGKNTPLKIIAVSPMPLATYREKVTDKDALAHHWSRAALRLELPNLSPSAAAGYDELQYEQLGVLIARRSHLLLALWDGQQSTVPNGGTASVVRMRQMGEHNVAVFRDSPLFRDAFSRLDLSPGGPVLQIVTPRASTGGAVAVPGQPDAKAGDCFLLPSPRDLPDAQPVLVSPTAIFDGLSDQVRQDFAQITRLNQQIIRFRGPDNRVFTSQLGYLSVNGVADPDGEPGAYLGVEGPVM